MVAKIRKYCPCGEVCKEKKVIAVNNVLENEACTAGKLRYLFLKSGIGQYSIRSSVEFLSSRKCSLVEVFTSPIDKKPMQFGRLGKLFYDSTLSQDKLAVQLISLLTPLQKRLLNRFSNQHKGSTYYFSVYDLRKLTPSAGNNVEYALQRLFRLGLIQKVTLGKTVFFTNPSCLVKFESQKQLIVVEDKIEYTVVKRVHELIMNLYPLDLIPEYKCRIRPHTFDVLKTTGGMTFDIFYEFLEPVMGRRYLAVDIYTRLVVTQYIVKTFLKKIEWAKTRTNNINIPCLKDLTHGIIVFKKATPKAINFANQNKIRFIRLSDIKTDYNTLREVAEKDLLNDPS